ncbi:MAG: hypothetical protein Tsb0014_35590 [Pleurocapsa sp.]
MDDKPIEMTFQIRLPVDIGQGLKSYSNGIFVTPEWVIKQAVIEYIKKHENEVYLTEYYSPMRLDDYAQKKQNKCRRKKRRDTHLMRYLPFDENVEILLRTHDHKDFPHELIDWIDIWMNTAYRQLIPGNNKSK